MHGWQNEPTVAIYPCESMPQYSYIMRMTQEFGYVCNLKTHIVRSFDGSTLMAIK